MVLYRTDEFSSNRKTDIIEVLFYELFERENEALFGNLLSVTLNEDFKKTLSDEYMSLLGKPDQTAQYEFIHTIVDYWSRYYKKDFKYAIWLYPLDSVKAFVEFNEVDEGMVPLIFGYEASDVAVITYEGEGTLYFYNKEPEVKEKR